MCDTVVLLSMMVISMSITGCSALRESGCDEILAIGGDGAVKSRVYQHKGVRHFEHGKLPAAAAAFEQAISLDGSNGSAHNNLGLVHYQQRKLSDAAGEFEIAARLMPENPTPLNNLGMTLEAAGKGFEALDFYHQAYDLSPREPLYLGNFVRTRIRLGENDESVIAQLQELLFIESRPDWIAWINDQLTLELNPYLDRGPAPASLNSKDKSKSDSSTKPLDNTDTDLNGWEAPIESQFVPDQAYEGETILATPADSMVEVEMESLALPDVPPKVSRIPAAR